MAIINAPLHTPRLGIPELLHCAHERPRRKTHCPWPLRWHCLLQIGRVVPRTHQGRRHRSGGDDRSRRAIRHCGHLAGAIRATGFHLAVGFTHLGRGRQQHGPHQPEPRGPRHCGGAGQRRFHGQAGAWPGRRPAEPDVPGAPHRPGAADSGAGHEPRNVGPPRHAAQRAAAASRRRHGAGCGRGRAGLRRNRRRPHAGARRVALRPGALLQPQATGRPAPAGERWPHLRGDRPGARPHQPLQRQDGLCHCACRA